MITQEENNKIWFDFYIKEFSNSNENGFVKYDEFFLCPCCNFPTLSERKNYEICRLCNWEDDGQDEHNEENILGGPNGNYSLKEAKENFKKYFTMYRPSDERQFKLSTIKEKNNKSVD